MAFTTTNAQVTGDPPYYIDPHTGLPIGNAPMGGVGIGTPLSNLPQPQLQQTHNLYDLILSVIQRLDRIEQAILIQRLDRVDNVIDPILTWQVTPTTTWGLP